MSVPPPIAIPTSACISAGASLMPSPTMATWASDWSPRTMAAFSCGKTLAWTSSIPSSRATHCAARLLSPVTRIGFSPALRKLATARPASDRIVSPSAMMPSALLLRATPITVRPAASSSSIRERSAPKSTPRSANKRGLPTRTSEPSIRASTPLPGSASNDSTSGGVTPRSNAALSTACASGCSDEASAAAAIARRPRSSVSALSISRMTGQPSVSVPVLSSTILLTRRKPWNASPVRIRMPFSAACPAPRTIESGAEMPTAHG
ncbi:hypothetical protein ES707_16984 [subsurface metagenome]